VSHETDLRTAIAYLADLDAELDERTSLPDPDAHASARVDMLYQLDHARQVVASLERRAPSLSCLTCTKGCEALVDLQKARAWCRQVEARIAGLCSDASQAAAA
jgi:cob(I)alamin adenosyltransferase